MLKKHVKTWGLLSLSAIMLLGGVPYNALASETFSKRELSKLNSVTQAVSTQGSGVSKVSSQLDTDSRKKVSVIVQLTGEPVAGSGDYRKGSVSKSSRSKAQSVSQEQSTFQKAAKKADLDFDIDQKFSYVFNGMVITLPANQIPELAKLPQVKYIHENRTYSIPDVEIEPEADSKSSAAKYDIAPLKQIGVLDMWKEGLNGKGLKVGVIDTGVDYLHPDLKDAYKGGYDSYDNDKDPYEEAPISPEDDRKGEGYEGSAHGTHVSGTIVGRAKNKQSDVQVKGIAYAADLYVYRVLGRGGGSSAQVIDGIEKAVRDGMDVINLSLGSDLEKNADSPDAIAVNNAMRAGVITVVANGNAADKEMGRWYYTAGSPAGAKLPISVGAVTSPTVLYDASAASSFGGNYDFHVMAWQIKKDNFQKLLGTKELPVVYANLGSAKDFQQVNAKGKVALVSRGTLAFNEKILNAKKAGAIAIVIFNGNDQDGDGQADLDLPDRSDYIYTVLGDQMEAIPTFDMKGAEGRALAKQLLSDAANADKLTFRFDSEYPSIQDPGDKMAPFSSRGPVLGDDYAIKPDVSAPGVSVLSSVPAWSKLIDDAKYDLAYARYNGTSMAAPHVAGLALLLKQAHPEWTPFDVKAALANTSAPLSDYTNTLYDVYSQGAGRVNGYAAMKTPAVLQTVEEISILNSDFERETITNYGANTSFGLMKPGSEPVTRTLQLKNTSKDSVSYSAEVVMHPSVTTNPWDPKATPDVDDIEVKLSDDTITSARGKATKFELTLAPERDAEEGLYEGEVVLKSKKSNYPDLHLPFVVHVGEKREDTKFGLDDMKLSDESFSPDGDGKDESISVEALLQASDVNVIELEAWSLDDTYIGTMAALFDNYRPFAPGPITFSNIDGTYVTGSLVPKKLEPGRYKLRLLASVVDTSKPKGEQVVKTYELWKSFRIEGAKSNTASSKSKLKQVADDFTPKVVNTENSGEAVLSLPDDADDFTYRVTKSSRTDFIDDDGVLVALPEESEVTVTLIVTIASKDDPEKQKDVEVEVKLAPLP